MLNQFSFSKYDSVDWNEFNVGDKVYPATELDEYLWVFTNEGNIYDTVVNDKILGDLQNFWQQFCRNYNKKHGTNVVATVKPNYYGSVFLGWSSDADDRATEATEVANVIAEVEDSGENVCYHECMPTEYEDWLMGLWALVNDPDQLDAYHEDVGDEAFVEYYNDLCNTYGYTGDVVSSYEEYEEK